jgi:branched-chain amino acid transport system substrate-binding protein
MGGSSTIGTFIVAVAMLAPAAAYSEQKYDSGVTDTEIKLGQTAPYSGPVSGYGTFGKASLAYFAMINEQGGVNGRKIKLITVDDGFSPPKTVEQTRKLVESDGIFFDFASVGTAPNFAIKQYLNDNKIPQLFLQSGIPSWNDPAHFPWSMSGLPNYATEVRVFAKYILETKPDARIAILYQNDDFGREYLNGMRARLGSQADKMLVGAQSFELSDPTVDSQMITLRSSGADVLLIVATQKQTVQALRKTHELDWHPLKLISFPAVSVTRTYLPAGVDAAKGAISSSVFVDPSDPAKQNDPDLRAYLGWMEKYYPAGDKLDGLNGAAYFEGQLVVDVLKRCGDLLTRENVMKQATSFRQFKAAMLQPGITVNTSPVDYNMFRKLQLSVFDGKYLTPFGAPISD